MKYNTIKNAVTTVNTTEGNVDLTIDQITELINVSEVTVKTLTANSGTGNYDKLVIDCDFGVRLHSGEMRYYFDSDVSNTAVVSGISFQYKNEEFQDYVSLQVYSNQNYYNTNVSGTLFAPRYIRFTHDLEQTEGFLTTLSGYVEGGIRGLELYNDDSYVDFGSDGTAEGDNISVAIGGDVDIRSVAIYNSGPNKATAYVSLDPTHTDFDKVIGVSNTENGPWVYTLDEEFSIVKSGEDDTYGSYSNTILRDGVISLTEYFDAYDDLAIRYENGSYTTKVFSNDSTTWNSIILDKVLPVDGCLRVDIDDGVETIEVKSSNYEPKSYHIYRELYSYHPLSIFYLRYKDKWIETDQTKAEPTINLLTASVSTYSSGGWKSYFIIIDQVSERWGGFAHACLDNSDYSEWWLFNVDSNSNIKSKRIEYRATDAVSFDWKDLKFDYEGGMWIYFYAVSYSSSNFVDTTGHYLCYFDKDMIEKFKYFNTVDFVGAMDVSYTTKVLWYAMPEANQLQKLSFNGTVLFNYFENTEDLGGLCVLDDKSIWYANAKNLYNLNENGLLNDTKTLEDVANNKFIVIAADCDGLEALWVLENFYVSRLLLYGERKGEKEFSVYVEHAIRLYPVASGVWVWCADVDNPGDSYMRYVSKVNKRIDREYKLNYNSTPGVLEHTYEDQMYAGKMPLTIDQEWSNLEWKKVNTESFILPEDNYHQVKVILRRQTPYQRYGDTVNIDDVFHTDDSFNQEDGSPNNLLWSEYRGSGRVYVEDNQLVMTNDPGGPYNSYINTNGRYVLTGNFDVRFDFVMGEGVDTGKREEIYLSAYATDAGEWGQYVQAAVYISPLGWASYVVCSINGAQQTTNLGTNYDRWTGKLRLMRSGNRVYAYLWDPQTLSWKSKYRDGIDDLGDYFYLKISVLRTGSNTYIDNFTVTAGTAYYYAESPKVKGIYTRKDIQLEDIYPNTSKNVYLKSQVLSTMDVEGHYDTSLKVRWRTPVE